MLLIYNMLSEIVHFALTRICSTTYQRKPFPKDGGKGEILYMSLCSDDFLYTSRLISGLTIKKTEIISIIFSMAAK